MFVALVYRPHNLYNDSDVAANNNLLCDMLKKIPKGCVIVGDFNFSEIDWENNSSTARSRVFLDTVNDLFLTQMLSFPAQKSGTMPDLILTDLPQSVIDIEDLGHLRSSDHSMLKVNLKTNTVRVKRM